jgi:hypothetical protein
MHVRPLVGNDAVGDRGDVRAERAAAAEAAEDRVVVLDQAELDGGAEIVRVAGVETGAPRDESCGAIDLLEAIQKLLLRRLPHRRSKGTCNGDERGERINVRGHG